MPTATASCCIRAPSSWASRRPSSSARPAPSCIRTATTASKCNSTGSAGRKAIAGWRIRPPTATRARPATTAPAPGSGWPRRWRPSPAPTGAATPCPAWARKCSSTSWKAISTAPSSSARCTTAAARRTRKTTRSAKARARRRATRRPGFPARPAPMPTRRPCRASRRRHCQRARAAAAPTASWCSTTARARAASPCSATPAPIRARPN
ncbi:hypothetical protein D3C81_1294620 [compost metagenome]